MKTEITRRGFLQSAMAVFALSCIPIDVQKGLEDYAKGRTKNLPEGWLECNGATVSKSDFPDLFKAVGGNSGDSGKTGFNLPGFRGMYIRDEKQALLTLHEKDKMFRQAFFINYNGKDAPVGSIQRIMCS